MVGHATSAAYKLWKQLKLLHQFVTILVVSKGKQGSDCIDLPELESDDGNSVRTETADVIRLLHEMDYIAVKNQGTACCVEVRKYSNILESHIFSVWKFIG